MLQAVRRGHSINPNHPDIHQCLVKFLRYSREQLKNADLSEAVRTVVEKQMESLYGAQEPASLNNEFLKRNSESLPHLIAGGCCYFSRVVNVNMHFTT